MNSDYDFYYEMNNCYDDSCIICGYDNGKAYAIIHTERIIKEFETEEKAYSYAFRKGYRE